MKRSLITVILIGILCLTGAVVGVGKWAYRQGVAERASESSAQLALYQSYLRGVLEKYEYLPELLANDKRLITFLENPGGRERIEAFNRYLETANAISDAADTYLMDREGLTIAASNWQTPRPFVGRNFSYRPYFQEAMRGKLGRYFALGTTSSQRGYYFAYPVRQGETILGALVMKINIDSVEENWKKQDATFLVTDPDGVIFITTKSNWRYRTLKHLSPQSEKRIVESKRYPDASLKPLFIAKHDQSGGYSLLSIQDEATGIVRTYLHMTANMPHAGWEVQILSDIKGVDRFVIRTIIGISSAMVIAIMIMLLFWQRQQQMSERHRYEEESRRVLEHANEVLESRVATRTHALTESNIKLRQEIIERKKTEAKLRSAREELVHAAKLAALGQMSASITHELNQPLAAIRAYTDNAVHFLQNERQQDAMWNLEQISELTERMAKLGSQLKLFARKESDKAITVALHGCLDGALEILGPSIKKSAAELKVQIVPEDLAVCANNVLLQQVLVNLIGNSLQAVEGQATKRISIKAGIVNDIVELRVMDNGPGIEPQLREIIFEPFVTTKEPGKGLGLGLTITSRIVREMGGSISYEDVGGGACFVVQLQLPDTTHENVDQGTVYR
ncbi:sensor histidine kinase [Desulfogranum japonicum]|uniref:sensor histidine kinase n=1 Tax=Desulfogranum japonicum TaxID=231447 RepID=UPI00040B9EC1|nr:ATP-binding protein [Desulfogranum japonicum]